MKLDKVLQETRRDQNIAKFPNTVSHNIKDLIGKMEEMTKGEIISNFKVISQRYSSLKKQKEWENIKNMNKNDMMKYITNIYLRGAGMGTNWRK